MRKILLVSEIFPPQHGGSGRWFWEIYRRFPQESVACLVGHHHRSESVDRGFPHPVYREELANNEWGVRSWTGLRYYLRTWRIMAKLARKESVEHVHCGRVLPEGLAALLLKLTHRIPYICYVHGEDVETAKTSRELKLLTSIVMRGAEKIIANSHNSENVLTEKWGVPKRKVVVMTPGVDIDKFHPDISSPRPASWVGKTVILTVGRLQKRKGQDMMIRTLPELIKTVPNLHYCIVGDGDEREPLEKLAEELGVADRVEFAGEVDDEKMVVLYQHCSLFALPNRRVGNDEEGFGMVLLEAQACGRPVLAGDSGGTKETFADGVTGILADCSEPKSLYAAVHGLIKDGEKLNKMGSEGRKSVARKFSWDSLTETAKREFAIATEGTR
ncbi:glycosyltransferase family 4 protein [Marinobacter segnicrescens]|uniref:glycosyltransferase family 4 protein n=1 Tax=Marinobacter segnicrescens TaxID=430453 RepID=UPI003A8F4E2A